MQIELNTEVDFLATYLAGNLGGIPLQELNNLVVMGLRQEKTRRFIFDKHFFYEHLCAQDQLIDYVLTNPVADDDLLDMIKAQADLKKLPMFKLYEKLLNVIYLIEQYQENREARKRGMILGSIRMFSPSREAFFDEITKLKQQIFAVNLHDGPEDFLKLYKMMHSLVVTKENEWLGRTNINQFTDDEVCKIEENSGRYKQEIAVVFGNIEIIFADIRQLFMIAGCKEMCDPADNVFCYGL